MNPNRAQIIIFGAIGVVVVVTLLLVTGIIPGLTPRTPSPFTLEVWGFEDPPAVWDAIASDYRTNGVTSATIHYTKKDPATYEGELIDALASGNGPDVFRLRDSWLEKHKEKIVPLPNGTLGYDKTALRTIFADSLALSIVNDQGALIGTPLAFDTLALFYNRDYFNAANIPSPPATWDDLASDAERLTKLSDVGGVRRSGVALGTATNVEHAADILMALIYQSGGAIVDAKTQSSGLATPATESAISFYTSFADATRKTYSWNSFFDNSLAAFARGDTAIAFGYASDVAKINELNPQLNFDVASFPQTARSDTRVTFARFNLLTVSRLSKQSVNAWNFLLWLQNKNTEKTYIDALGLPPARRDLVNSNPPQDYLTSFYDGVLPARTIPIRGDDSLPQIISDMIDSVVNHKFTIKEAITRADSQINALFKPVQ